MLAPAFLFGLAALSVPLPPAALLRRRSTSPQPFSSLLFFEPRTQRAVRHRRLRYLLLLALRLALLMLLVLAFTKPFIQRPRALASASKLQLLVIDRSFSMQAGSSLEMAKREALAQLARHRQGDPIEIMSLGSDLQLLTAPTQDEVAARAAINSIRADDSRADLGELVSAARQAHDESSSQVELHLFTDLQRSSLPANFNEMLLPDGVTLVVHPLAQADTPNWTVLGVTAPAQVWGRSEDVKPLSVQAVVAGFATPAADRTVSLFVNGKSVASQRVHVPANGQARVQFDNVVLPHGLSRCEVRLDAADALPQDDSYRFAIERLDPQQVLFLHADTDTRSTLYFTNALVAADGSAFSVRALTPTTAAEASLNGYAFIVLSNLPSLSPSLQERLERYARAGGNVLVALGTGAAGYPRVVLFDAPLQRVFRTTPSRAVAGTERFASVGETADRLAGVARWDDALVERQILYALRVDPQDAQVLVRLTDHTPLLLEKRFGEGRVLLLATGLEGIDQRPATAAGLRRNQPRIWPTTSRVSRAARERVS